MATTRYHLFVSGEVQGVGFRAFVRRHAQALGLAGWVKNLDDGRVEVVAEGEEGAVKELAERCRRGYSWSRVESVEVAREETKGERGGFRIVY